MIIPAQGGALLFPKEEQRRKKIYIVTQGVHSDYHVIGYAETEAEARRVCDLINEKKGKNDDEAVVEECYRAADVQEGRVCNIFAFAFRYISSEGRTEYDGFDELFGEVASFSTTVEELPSGDLRAIVPIAAEQFFDSKLRAARIAYDEIAKYRARKLDL